MFLISRWLSHHLCLSNLIFSVPQEINHNNGMLNSREVNLYTIMHVEKSSLTLLNLNL